MKALRYLTAESWTRAWILVNACFVATGWALSSLRLLDWRSYLAVFALVILALSRRMFRRDDPASVLRCTWPRNGGSRPFPVFPGIFAALALLSLLGGVLHEPNNYDALTYRLPRVFNWLAERSWFWIETSNPRVNYSGTNFEWMMTPIIALTRSDRLLFVLNFLPYLLLPSLLFAVYRQLGVLRRVAWFWMWIMPTAYCFAMQAGGIGNDAYAAILLLASIWFAFRAGQRSSVTDAWWSILAVALLTGVKASNLPLVLPWLAAIAPARQLLTKEKVRTLAILTISGLVSFLPTAILNHRYTASWNGDPANMDRMQMSNPVVGIVGNGVQVAAQALQPPVLPGARQLMGAFNGVLPDRVTGVLAEHFPRFQPVIGELPQEEAAGLGLGVTTLLLLSTFTAIRAHFSTRNSRRGLDGQRNAATAAVSAMLSSPPKRVIAGSWIACLAMMALMGSEATARLMAPYYVLLVVPFILHRSNDALTRSRVWRTVAALAAGSAIIGLTLSPSRPLVPVQQGLSALAGQNAPGALIRAKEVYAVYDRRHDILAPVAAHLPAGVREVGLVAGVDDAELALWWPCCERRVRHLTTRSALIDDARRIQWVVGSRPALERRYGPLEAWLADTGAELIAVEEIRAKVSENPIEWFVANIPR